MKKLTLANSVTFACTVSLWDFAQAIGIDYDSVTKAADRIERLRYVSRVEDAHQFWCKLELETGSAATAERRISATLIKIEKILRSYVKSA